MNWRVQRLDVTASTNDDVKKAAERGEPAGLVIYALKQIAGRGRHGRVWNSPEGNLYCSVLLRPTCAPQHVGLYSFVVGLALWDLVAAILPQAKVTLKWPNDVLVKGQKISGVLLEAGPTYLVIGMGLNIVSHPEDALYPTTSLAFEGMTGEVDLKAILEQLLERLQHWVGVLESHGFDAIRERWLLHAEKGPTAVKLPNGVIKGSFVGINDAGSLCLQLADGTEQAIHTGDVFPAVVS